MTSSVSESIGLRARRAIDRWTLLRRVVKSRRAQRLITVLRLQPLVENRLMFTVAELFRPPRTETFRVRASDVNVVLRTRTPDALVLGEVFGLHAYEPPPQVSTVLQATGDPLRVLDLGGNIGLFGAFVLQRFPGATITSIEPDPSNAQILTRCIGANNAAERWTLIEACAGTQPGHASLCCDYSHTRVESTSRKGTIQVPVIDMFPLADRADFLKIDIEGSEWPILADSRLSEIKTSVIVLEWHQQMSPTDDARASALEALEASGFNTLPEPPSPYTHGLVWAWRDGLTPSR